MRKIIASLDIGDAWIKLVVGEIVRNKLNILACLDVPARGIKKGYVVNAESAIEALTEIFNQAEETIGIRPTKVVVSVPSNDMECFLSEGSVSISPDTGVISKEDVDEVFKACTHNKIEDNKELVTVLPTRYTVNDVDVVENPIGVSGLKLTLKAIVVTVPKKNVNGIIKCLEKINIEVIDIALGSLGDFFEFKDKINIDGLGAVVNIGAFKTEVAIFNKGNLTSCEVVDIGGDNIDYDLSYVYKINRRDSMYLKECIALADKNLAQPTESIIFDNRNGEKVKINQFDASEVVISRLEEILNLVKKQINLLTKKQISYIIITGGTTEMGEFKSLVDSMFNNATVGEVLEIGARHNKYSTAVGLIKYYDRKLKLSNKEFSIYNIEEQEDLSGLHKKVNISEDSVLGKLFRYFFDN